MSNDQRQMMRLARTRQNSADVGACGPMYNPTTQTAVSSSKLARLGISGVPANQAAGCMTPPGPIPPNLMVKDGAIATQCTSPITLRFGVDSAGNIYNVAAVGAASVEATVVGADAIASQAFAATQLIGDQIQFRSSNGVISGFGVRTFGLNIPAQLKLSATTSNGNPNNTNFNDGTSQPGFVFLTSLQAGDSDIEHLLGNVDQAFYNTASCFCPLPADLCFSVTNPLRIRARSAGVPGANGTGTYNDGLGNEADERVAPLNITLWSTKLQSLNACGPTAAYAGMIGR